MRRTPLKSTRPKPSAAERETRILVAARSDGWCELRLPGCTGSASDMAHRIGRKMGGRPLGDDWRASNVLHSCRVCHMWCHGRPKEAQDLGLLLTEGRDPEVEPVAYRNAGWVRLQDDGGMWPA